MRQTFVGKNLIFYAISFPRSLEIFVSCQFSLSFSSRYQLVSEVIRKWFEKNYFSNLFFEVQFLAGVAIGSFRFVSLMWTIEVTFVRTSASWPLGYCAHFFLSVGPNTQGPVT
jgi:hypothetical protein